MDRAPGVGWVRAKWRPGTRGRLAVLGPGTRGRLGRCPGRGRAPGAEVAGHPGCPGGSALPCLRVRAPGVLPSGHPGCPGASLLHSSWPLLPSLAPWMLESSPSPSHDHLLGILECITCLYEVEPNSHANPNETRRGESQARSRWCMHVLLSTVHSVLAVVMDCRCGYTRDAPHQNSSIV